MCIPTRPQRHCQWLTDAATDLRHGFPAALAVDGIDGGTDYWYVTPTEGGYDVYEELPNGAFRKRGRIDTTFGGGAARYWECDCAAYRCFRARRCEAGCLHVKVVFAAMARIGLAGTVKA